MDGALLFVVVLSLKSGLVWSESNGVRNLTLGSFITWEQGWPTGPFLGSAIILGIREVERREILPGYKIQWILGDDYCDARRGMKLAVDMWSSTGGRVDAFIGPPCSSVCQPVSLLAAAWQIPIVSYGCSSPSMLDKSNYPTFTHTIETDLDRAAVYDKIVARFGWERVGIITTTEDINRLAAVATMAEMEANGKTVILKTIDSIVEGSRIIPEKQQILIDTIEEMKTKVRIVIFLSFGIDVRHMLIAALDAGMMNGEFAFLVNMWIMQSMMDIEQTYRPEVDPIIYSGLLAMDFTFPTGPEWDRFLQDVIDAFQDPRFDHLPHLPADADIREVNAFAGSIYDAVLQWAYGVNKTIAQGLPPNDGHAVTANIYNSIYEGIRGKIAIDEVGNRKPDLRVLMIHGAEREVLMHWSGAEQEMEKIYKPEVPDDWSGLYWYGNSSTVPLDHPKCGWRQELCDKGNNGIPTTMTSLIIVVVLVVCAVILLVTFSLIKYREQGNLKTIEEVTIMWQELDQETVPKRAQTIKSYNDNQQGTNIHKLKIARYKENLVTIHDLGKVSISLKDPKVLEEVKNLKQLTHDNITSFVGICPHYPHVCYFMGYSARGSLADVLSDNELNLTKDFKISFLLDIATGMDFLHKSSLQVHGMLSSAVIVVNSRWTCQITGHGLNYIKIRTKASPSTDDPTELLWTAPELLNDPLSDILNCVDSARKGDVYSYGIIAQEVFLNSVPYSANEPKLSPEETVEQVRKSPIYRPSLPSGVCPEGWTSLIQTCWHSDPSRRPPFIDVLKRIYVIHKDEELGIIDSMIRRLERHAVHLEDRVSLRSSELQAEKDKMERLLSELLPSSVSAMLTAGIHVHPEMFNNVSIFFSDIVGFTSISSKANPMEIVFMLNKMYTLFDDVAQGFDAYKVATIGDAYMVASGVPVRNGDQHGREICALALCLLQVTEHFPIPHLPEECLRMRVGIHSGPCVAGVCGVKMPRYLLFGDTVDTAAKMESGGKAMKIHISEATRSLVRSHSEFSIKVRDNKEEKTHFDFTTYWLNRGS